MQPTDASRPPRVLSWYRLYCRIMIGLSLVDVLGGLALLLFRQNLADCLAAGVAPPWDISLSLLVNFGPLLAAVAVGTGTLMTALFALTFFLPRNPWAWVYHLALIGLGLTDCFFFLPCLFLMISWLRPRTRTYFGCDKWMS